MRDKFKILLLIALSPGLFLFGAFMGDLLVPAPLEVTVFEEFHDMYIEIDANGDASCQFSTPKSRCSSTYGRG